MRILFLSHRYTDTTIGGLAEFLHYLPKSLKAKGVDCCIYTRSKDETNERQSPERLPNNLLHYSGPFLKPSFFLRRKALQPLIELCQTEQIDLIHAQGTYRAGFMAMHASLPLKIPYVITSHSDILEINSKRMQRGNIKRRCQAVLKNAAAVTHLSPIMEHASDRIQDTHHKSTLIHNGIDLAAWDAYQALPEHDYVLAIGRLEQEKGFHILIDAINTLHQSGCTTSLVIAGTGSYEKALQEKAKALGLSVVTDAFDLNQLPNASVIFTGYVRAEQKKNWFAHAKAVLFATQPAAWEEAFGIVQLEAMAASKAIIASDITITRYLQSLGMQARLVTAHDVNAWSQAMAALLDNPKQRASDGKMNHACAKKFDWQLIANEYATLYERLIPSA